MSQAFRVGQRIRVTMPAHALDGLTGTVRELRLKDSGAWAECPQLPPRLRWFQDDLRRRNWTLIFPELCTELHEGDKGREEEKGKR